MMPPICNVRVNKLLTNITTLLFIYFPTCSIFANNNIYAMLQGWQLSSANIVYSLSCIVYFIGDAYNIFNTSCITSSRERACFSIESSFICRDERANRICGAIVKIIQYGSHHNSFCLNGCCICWSVESSVL